MLFWKEKQNFSIIQAVISRSESTIEVLEQITKYVQSQEDRPQNNSIAVVLEPSLLTSNMF